VFHATQPFRSLTLADPDGAFPQRLGPTLVVTLTEAQRKRLEAGQRVAHVEPQTEQAAAAVVVVVPVGRPDRRRWAYAELNPAYLWGDLAAWPTAMQFCVAEWSSLAPIFCAGAVPEAACAPTAGSRRGRRGSRSRGRPTARASVRRPGGLFLNVEFRHRRLDRGRDAARKRNCCDPRSRSRRVLPVAALALLVVVWLSLRLIRSTLTPLEQLTRATRRVVAHDFGSRVEITRDDEFGELASAFNAMTRRLGKQFTALNAMAEIDREILSSRDLERVVLTALRHLHHLVPAQAIGVVLLDQDNGSLARTSFAACRRPEDVTTVRIPLGADDATLLRQSPAGTWFPATEPCPECIRVVLSSSAQAAFAYPIEWREALCGSLVFAVDAPTSLTEDELAQVREAAARMAVAVSSAWRDAQLYRQAHFDALTGLPNRPLFLDRLSQEIAHCQRDDTRFSLLFIDLDHFKKINDTQGHSRGDAVLVETAQRLLRCVRSSDTVARLGGDEFTISIRQAANQAEVGRVVQQVLSRLAEPFDIDGQQSYLGASIGIAAFPLDGATAEELLKNADTAMYRAKASGRGQAVYYQETMNREAREVVALEREGARTSPSSASSSSCITSRRSGCARGTSSGPKR
jgi:diguanylate cyclase (GGDEF)-like protein